MKDVEISNITDREYLLRSQYRTPDYLAARVLVHKRFSTSQSSWYEWVLEKIDIAPNMHLLEVGCGNGDLWNENCGHKVLEFQGILTDLSPGMVTAAKLSLSRDDRFLFSTADAQELPFACDIFDRIIANHMLYHVPQIEKALREFKRVLKPGGYLCAATNGMGHMQELHQLIGKYYNGFETRDRSSHRFGLENAREIVNPFFRNLKIHHYEDDLWVTDAKLLAAYIASMRGAEEISYTVLESIKVEIEEIINREGGFKIHKSTGIVIACS